MTMAKKIDWWSGKHGAQDATVPVPVTIYRKWARRRKRIPPTHSERIKLQLTTRDNFTVVHVLLAAENGIRYKRAGSGFSKRRAGKGGNSWSWESGVTIATFRALDDAFPVSS